MAKQHSLLPPLLNFLLFFSPTIRTSHAYSAEKAAVPSSSSFSFSFSSFDPTICQTSLLFHGDTHLISDSTGITSPSSPPSSAPSSIQIGGSSPNSSGSLFFSHPISMSASTSFSSSFSFSLADDLPERNRNPNDGGGDRSNFSFVVVSSPFPSSSSGQVSILASMELDSLFTYFYRSAVQSYAEALKAQGQPLKDIVQACVEYNSLEKMVEIRLSKPLISSPSPPILASYHLDDVLLAQHSSIYVGFMFKASGQKHYYIIHTWNFKTYDSSEHSMPFDPNQDHHQHHHTLLTLENAYTRAFTMILSVVLFSSVSAIALWALVERAFRKSRREVAMLPILCDYEKVQTLNEDKEETIKEQQ